MQVRGGILDLEQMLRRHLSMVLILYDLPILASSTGLDLLGNEMGHKKRSRASSQSILKERTSPPRIKSPLVRLNSEYA